MASAQAALTCRASYCEIYNEALYDLLKFSKAQLPVRWDALRGFHCPDLVQRDCSSMADLMQARAQCCWSQCCQAGPQLWSSEETYWGYMSLLLAAHGSRRLPGGELRAGGAGCRAAQGQQLEAGCCGRW